MRRVIVAGITGAGKTTLARELAGRLGVPFHELDAVRFTGPGWATDPDFRGTVSGLTGAPGWTVDSYGYPEVRDLLWARADTVVWLDYPRRVVMYRVLRRSLRRTLRRERIFGGNVEPVAGWFSAEHPVRWAWTQHGPRRTAIDALTRDPAHAHLTVHRFRSPRRTADWLRTVPGAADRAGE